ncbi:MULTISPECIES: histidine phosphatase family protein [unclassified Bacillus (in: firmicutes)]|uniref:histidine phosphatase family protein n=1 Tax=unclassified Bacillus (in: firmicutes) TaxID=185979 RepID=UPI0008E08203|nr:MULTISPECIES: histidine phosphatase family protein [unclassified Bacillus (in: firmicutes)]SFA89544.1 Histidine phosphatase superfamily (branch 1) [Bacillus sp. UNCCL13]SFQ84953.1 Histidine phosphatase superfamily (branch 1) [Bacillus sp. cl95]
MRVGLLRHFEVKRGYPSGLVTSEELMNWVKEYDESEVMEKEIDLCNIEWMKCYSSDLPRASTTARKAFNGEIVYINELRELSLSPILRFNIKLPLTIHLILIRLAWFFNHSSQPVSKKEVIQKINDILDRIIGDEKEDVLIVGHGGVMIFMRKELIKRGFVGPKFNRPENAKLYVYENKRS